MKSRVSELERKVRLTEMSMLLFVLEEKDYFISSNIRKIDDAGGTKGDYGEVPWILGRHRTWFSDNTSLSWEYGQSVHEQSTRR